MRAAEIHEVLQGLKDFKNRIIDGALRRRHCLCLSVLTSEYLYLIFHPLTLRFFFLVLFSPAIISLSTCRSLSHTADATRLAKKVRAPKKQLEAALASHPDIIKIDGHIAELEEELRTLGDR